MKILNLQKGVWKNRFLLFLLLTYGTGFFMMAFLQNAPQMAWYETLKRSSLTPPGYIFSIVWSILYFLIALSASIIWKNGSKTSKGLFFAQLIVQVIWSYSFFYIHAISLALIVLILLCLIIFLMISNFYRYSKTASYLLIPYFLWCVFASYLNFMTAYLN